MANERVGSYSELVTWKEATYNTVPGGPVGYQIPVIAGSGSLACTRELADMTELRGDPNPSRPARGFWRTAGGFSTPIESTFPGYLLNRVFGTYSVTGPVGGLYTHVHKISATDPDSFGCEVWNKGADILRGDRYHGLLFNHLGGKVTKAATEATLDWGVVGSGKHDFDQAVRVDATPDTYTGDRYNANDVEVYIDTVESTLVESIEWNIDRMVEPRYVLDGEDYAYTYVQGKYTVSGRITGLWDQTSTLRVLASGEAEHALYVKYVGPTTGHYLAFYFDEVYLEVIDAQPWGDDGALLSTIQWKAYYANDADASAARAELVNTTVTYSGL
jgi:hypothetical protein